MRQAEFQYNYISIAGKSSHSNLKRNREDLKKEITSTRATKDAIIMAKASPASNEGAPH